jgi:hypothetical protein
VWRILACPELFNIFFSCVYFINSFNKGTLTVFFFWQLWNFRSEQKPACGRKFFVPHFLIRHIGNFSTSYITTFVLGFVTLRKCDTNESDSLSHRLFILNILFCHILRFIVVWERISPSRVEICWCFRRYCRLSFTMYVARGSRMLLNGDMFLPVSMLSHSKIEQPAYSLSFSIFCDATAQKWRRSSHVEVSNYTQTHTFWRTPLNNWSALLRGRYLFNTKQPQ